MRQWLSLLVGAISCTLIVGCHPSLGTAGRSNDPGAASTSGQSGGQVGEYTSVNQVRLYDSRTQNEQSAGQLLAGQKQRVRLNGALGVPHDAGSLVVRVNATSAEPAYITIFADGKPQPETPTVAISDSTVESRDALVPLHGTLAITVTTSVAAQLTIDLLGYVMAKPVEQNSQPSPKADQKPAKDPTTNDPQPATTPKNNPKQENPTGQSAGNGQSRGNNQANGNGQAKEPNPAGNTPNPAVTTTAATPDPELPAWQREMLMSVNAARANKGLAPLTFEPCVSDRVAKRWADQAASGQTTSSFKLESVRLVCQNSHGATGLSASGMPSANDVVTSWLAKPNLAKQLLDKHINSAGFGRTQANGRIFWSFVGVEQARPVPAALAGTRRGVDFNVTETSPGSGVLTRWPCNSQITVRLVGSTPPGADVALAKAVGYVRQASNLPLVVGAPRSQRSDDRQVIEVAYGPVGTFFRDKPIPAPAAGVGGPKWLTSGRIFRGDVLIRSDHAASDPATASGLQVLAHEIAHTLGVGHALDGRTEVMAPQTTPALAKRLKAMENDPQGSFWGRGDQSALRMIGCPK